MASTYVPNAITVAVRVRPLSILEQNSLAPTSSSIPFSGEGSLSTTGLATSTLPLPGRAGPGLVRRVVKVLDDRVCVFDPPETSPIASYQRTLLGPSVKKVKDIRFCFDKVFGETSGQEDVFRGCAEELVPSVLDGFNATVFAYGATGCGKTHTISGTPAQPGIVFLLMKDLFDRIAARHDDMVAEVTVSYLEIYNETIRDLLVTGGTTNLTLREADGRVAVAGLSEQTPKSAEDIVNMIIGANANRSVSATEANASSSRSHAVLSVNVKQRAKSAALTEDYTMATLSIIDLAGSERASVTKNKGDRLLEGANINRSLLALGNCINALCDPKKINHVPYRDSKLTRLLKHSLGGNCRTVMIVCVSPSSQYYDETFNTLQYANRAKEIKTKVTRNIVSVDRHVSQYVRIIYELQQELAARKLADKKTDGKLEVHSHHSYGKTVQEAEDLLAAVDRMQADFSSKTFASTQGSVNRLESISMVLKTWKASVSQEIASADISCLSPFDQAISLVNELISDSRIRIETFKRSLCSFRETCEALLQNAQLFRTNSDACCLAYQRLVKERIRVAELELSCGVVPCGSVEPCDTRDIESIRVAIGAACTATEHRLRTRIQESKEENAEPWTVQLAHVASFKLFFQPFLSAQGFGHFASPACFNLPATGTSLRDADPYVPWQGTLKRRSTAPASASAVEHAACRPSKISRTTPAISKSPRRAVKAAKVSTPAKSKLRQGRASLKPLNGQGQTVRAQCDIAVARRASQSRMPTNKKRNVVWKDHTGEQLTEEHSKSMSDSDISMIASRPCATDILANASTSSVRCDLLGQSKLLSTPAVCMPAHASSEKEDVTDQSSMPGVSSIATDDLSSSDRSLDIGHPGSTFALPGAASLGVASVANKIASCGASALRPTLRALAASNRADSAQANLKPNEAGIAVARDSSAGPIRGSRKLRRTSFIDPGDGTLHVPNANLTTSLHSPGSPRRPSRVVPLRGRTSTAPSRRSLSQNTVKPISSIDVRIAAARARRESQAHLYGTAGTNGGTPDGSFIGIVSKPHELSLDLAASRAPVWR